MRNVHVLFFVSLCSCGWNPSRPFERDAPAVSRAVLDLDAGDAASATKRLEEYLGTGDCKDGNIGTPDSLKRRADGTFDLGLALFRVSELFGRRFGEEEEARGAPDEARRAQRHALVECARRIVETVVESDTAGDLRARSHYLDGNLAFLDGDYRAAVRAYDRALAIAPGEADGGDPVGRDAAWNRAIALRRIDEQKDAGSDASQDAGSDSSSPQDGGRDASHDGGRGKDAGSDASRSAPDSGAGNDAQTPPPPPPDAASEPPDAGAPPPANADQDERMLNQLENAPTLQQEEAKRFNKRRVRGMADK